MKQPDVVVNKLNKNHTVTVRVKISKQFRMRIAIASALIKAAAFVLGCGIEISNEFKRD